MLATQCSFCKHENTPGARFCAECGSPMHLKVCANPACGKVSDVSAAVCETCGVPFPQIKLFDPHNADMAATASATLSYVEITEFEKPRTSVWPLVAVAVVAGSLPLLWANREHLPAPKSGPFSKPEITNPVAVPTLPAPALPVPAPAVATPIPLAPVPPATTAPPAPSPAPSAGELDPAGAASTAAAPATAKPAQSRQTAKKIARAPVKKAEPAPACTEAVAALGLCDPKQVRK